MRFSILHELQSPRPQAANERLLQEALEQVELADRLGYHAVWVPERHFQEERAASSSPAVFLAAAAARTKTIRLGYGPVPLAVHHPAAVAETTATLDLVSGGRVELATSEVAAGAEAGAFGVARSTQRERWRESLGVVARMMAETPFAGVDGEFLKMPARNVVPKPVQAPHPPLWLGGAKHETARIAAENGLGALLLTATDPEGVKPWVDEYYEILSSDRLLPVGFSVQGAFALALPMMVHADEAEAIARGLDGAHFSAYAAGHYEAFGRHRPGRTSVWGEFQARRDDVGLARSAIAASGDALSVRVLRGGLGSLRGAIGTPEQVRELVARYAEAGVDELVLGVATGGTRHDDVLEALELFAAEVMPAFAGSSSARRAEVRGAAAAARQVVRDDYAFGAEDDGAALAANGEVGSMGDSERSGSGGFSAFRKGLEVRGEKAFQAFVGRSDDARLERTIGSGPGLKVVFGAMERQFVPSRAGGFSGDIQYNLRDAGGTVRSWTVTIGGQPVRARARAGAAGGEPKLTITLALADFIRIAGRDLDPVQAVLTGRMELAGDFGVALKLGEMFGQPSAI